MTEPKAITRRAFVPTNQYFLEHEPNSAEANAIRATRAVFENHPLIMALRKETMAKEKK